MKHNIRVDLGSGKNRSLTLALVLAFGCLVPIAAAAAGPAAELTVGNSAPPTLLATVFQLLIAGWAFFLLFAGPRYSRWTVATLALTVGFAIGMAFFAEKSYVLALLTAAVVFVFAMAFESRLPRFLVAIACFWPLPAVYLVYLVWMGAFYRSMVLALGLAVAGIAVAAIWPRAGRVMLSSALAGVLLAAVLSIEPVAAVFVVVTMAGMAGHALLALLTRGAEPEEPAERSPVPASQRTSRWLGSLAWGLGTLVAVVILFTALVPSYGPAEAVPDRLAHLVESGTFDRPSLVITPDNNLYLSGQAIPVALVSEQPSLADRLLLPVTGRTVLRPIHEMRAVKSEAELAAMRRAAEITSLAFARIAPMIQPGTNEAEIEAAILQCYRDNGATGVAFKSIVASGENALLPHYERNNDTLDDGFIVIDIGCMVDGYASDMTRTFAVRGELTEAQRHLLQVVATAHEVARRELRPGTTLRELDKIVDDYIEQQGFAGFMPHGLGHHVGLNVHDPFWGELEPGMVVTIEPGLYIRPGTEVDPEYWNLAARIEDSYIVTEQGSEAITHFPWGVDPDLPAQD